MKHFTVHRRLSSFDYLDVKEEIESVLDMAEVDNMKLLSIFTYTDMAHIQHLYLIFEDNVNGQEQKKTLQDKGK